MGNDKRFVRDAFAAIAPRYDLLNTLLSFGIDARWRRKALSRLALKGGGRVLDVCAGTLTLSREILERSKGGTMVASLDFCLEMLELGLTRLDEEEKRKILPLCGDAESLPLMSSAFEAVLVTYGLRNLEDPESAILEMFRALKPGGRLVILDFLRPRTPVIAALYGFYLRRILPKIGGLVSGSYAAYQHLSRSIHAFMDAEDLLSLIERSGFENARIEPLTLGIAGVFSAQKP